MSGGGRGEGGGAQGVVGAEDKHKKTATILRNELRRDGLTVWCFVIFQYVCQRPFMLLPNKVLVSFLPLWRGIRG